MRIFLWRSNSWISRKSFPTWLRRIVAAEWRNPCAVISPTPRALQAQAEGFKSWLVSIAGKVANAATEGGFFGFGGEKVSGAETAAINELASSLGVKA